jgi:hypothetical protein
MDQVIDAALLKTPLNGESRESAEQSAPQVRPLRLDEREAVPRERKLRRPVTPDDDQRKDEEKELERPALIIPPAERLSGESYPHAPA